MQGGAGAHVSVTTGTKEGQQRVDCTERGKIGRAAHVVAGIAGVGITIEFPADAGIDCFPIVFGQAGPVAVLAPHRQAPILAGVEVRRRGESMDFPVDLRDGGVVKVDVVGPT